MSTVATRRESSTTTDKPLLAAQERFAELVAGGSSYAGAYREAYGRPVSHAAEVAGSDLARNPRVARRIRELQRAAAEVAALSIAERMRWLDTVANTPSSEVVRSRRCPCAFCWTDSIIADRMDRWLQDPGTPCPDTTAPRIDCYRGPHTVVDLVPTAELSEAGRAILKGYKVNSAGQVEAILEDRMQAIDILNRMESVYVTRSENKNLNVTVAPPRDITTDDILALYHSQRAVP